MRTLGAWILSVILMGTSPAAHSDPPPLYHESQTHAQTFIPPQKIGVRVSVDALEFKRDILDANGDARFRLICRPFYESEKRKTLLGWDVELRQHKRFGPKDLLNDGNNGLGDECSDTDFMGFVWPDTDPALPGKEPGPGGCAPPVFATRVVGLAPGYCVIRVLGFEWNDVSKGTLKSLALDVEFTDQYTGPRLSLRDWYEVYMQAPRAGAEVHSDQAPQN